ncbi:MAG: 30S ribosomal protein S17 [Planctomycetales bacterium 4484_123]|nr:MAG: 30S ribosomal protein S17 [Planctomycetales bacterium 4484_123]
MAETREGQANPSSRRRPAVKQGVVDSISGAKTVRVVVNELVRHRLYGKYVRRRSRFLVHDPKSEAKVGDVVQIAPCRPMSKRKTWRLVRVVRAAQAG